MAIGFNFSLNKDTREVSFTDTTTPSASAWSWNFGDTTSAFIQNPLHVYSADGIYSVTMYATTSAGTSALNKSVSAAQLDVSFVSQQTADKTLTLTPTQTGAISAYSWSFGDGNISGGSGPTILNPSYTYSAHGVYPVQLSVSGMFGLTDSYSASVQLINLNPAFSATIDGKEITIINQTTPVSATYRWTFGDVGGVSTSTNPVHVYASDGLYTISLSATMGLVKKYLTKTARISTPNEEIIKIGQTKLTFETSEDVARPAGKHVIIKDNDDRLLVFYEKTLNTGRQSNGKISSDSSSFILSADAGFGRINGQAVSWSFSTVTADTNDFHLMYVTSAGVVGITTNFDMTFTASVIMLALVFTGGSGVTILHQLEKTGKYIFVRRQKPDGSGGWLWDNYEDIMNSGENPTAFFNFSDNKIYLTYNKDSAIYQRIIQVGSETNAWDYLLDYSIQAGPQIVPNNDPQQDVEIGISAPKQILNIEQSFDQIFDFETDDTKVPDNKIMVSSPRSVRSISEELFQMGPIGFGYFPNKPLGQQVTWNKFLLVPYISWATGIYGSLDIKTIDIYTGSLESMVLAESIPYTSAGTWKNVDAYSGQIFVGFTGIVGIFYLNKVSYSMLPTNRSPFYINPTLENRNDQSPTEIRTNPWVRATAIEATSPDVVRTTSSFDQIFDFETDDTKVPDNKIMVSSPRAIQTIT